jgi:Domain of unknown function (DUF3883)
VASLNLTQPQSVLQAVAEFNELGRDAFLAKYGFGKAREYFLLLNSKRYDAKAIAGVAHGYEDPKSGPLPSSDFSGGEQTVRRILQSLGFTVVKGVPRPSNPDALVLVENEVTVGGEYDFWADDTGARYHFPNQYRNRVRPGLPFVYYRGVRRSGGKRGAAEYFGTGFVGDVWLDPELSTDTPARNRRWYCAIEDYVSFPVPVPAKREGTTYENIQTAMGWRTAVREISTDVLDAILLAARAVRNRSQLQVPSLASVQLVQSAPSELVITRPRPKAPGSTNADRLSTRRMKEIGDWAEELVYRWLCETLAPSEQETVDWVAQRGETPGWDISYFSEAGAQISVEVKATTSGRFSSIDITGNEWRAAELHGENYVLVLVTRAVSERPRIALLWNPSNLVDSGNLQVQPMSFRLTWNHDV